MSVFDKNQSQRNAFERLLAKIPGFRGYLNKEWRRESDKIERDAIAKAFDNSREPLRRTGRKLADTGGFDGMKVTARINDLENLIEKIADRIRFADYGYSGFFDAVKVGEQELDRMYQFDLALYEKAEELEKRCREVPVLASDPEGLDAEIELLSQLVRQLDRDYDLREKIVTGTGA
ncbi:MAG: hypothetical protein HUU15_13100 [Candidatus Brocadiae bacterium]|nr:hypothetical protein [Candidatus Brocadiia bacterium]